jgi:hypothetical protein
MASLRDLADRALQRSRHDGTPDGTSLEQAEQINSVFHAPYLVPGAMERTPPRKSAKNEPCSTVPLSRDGTDGTPDLPSAIVAGVRSLRSLPCPQGLDPRVWRIAIVDALKIADSGWSAKALALGWTDLDLFGAVPNADGDPADDGLALWLDGRELLAMTADYAVAAHPGGRAYFNRREASGAVLLWALGRGR